MMLHRVALISAITLTRRCSRRVASARRTPAAGRSCVIGGIAMGTPSRHRICGWHHRVMFNHLSLLTVRSRCRHCTSIGISGTARAGAWAYCMGIALLLPPPPDQDNNAGSRLDTLGDAFVSPNLAIVQDRGNALLLCGWSPLSYCSSPGRSDVGAR